MRCEARPIWPGRTRASARNGAENKLRARPMKRVARPPNEWQPPAAGHSTCHGELADRMIRARDRLPSHGRNLTAGCRARAQNRLGRDSATIDASRHDDLRLFASPLSSRAMPLTARALPNINSISFHPDCSNRGRAARMEQVCFKRPPPICRPETRRGRRRQHEHELEHGRRQLVQMSSSRVFARIIRLRMRLSDIDLRPRRRAVNKRRLIFRPANEGRRYERERGR
jgi:hypothetical protein